MNVPFSIIASLLSRR